MVKGLCNIDNMSPTSLQLSAIRFVEELLGVKCPTPYTMRVVDEFLDTYLEPAQEYYDGDYDDICNYLDEWDYTQG